MGDYNEEKAKLIAEFKENVKLIQEIIPKFTISDDQIEQYVNERRFKLHEEAVQQGKLIDDAHEWCKNSGKVPEAYVRNFFTFYDASAGAEGKNKEVLDNINMPTEKGNLLRKQMFVDTLNKIADLDGDKIFGDSGIDDKAEYVLKNTLLYERGFEFQRTNRDKKNSLGFGFSEEQEKNITKIENKAVALGGKARAIRNIMKSRLCLTFPFELLTDEQFAMLHSSIQKNLEKRGVARKDAEEYTKFISSIFNTKMALREEEPKKEHYRVEDAKDIMAPLAEMRENIRKVSAEILKNKGAHKSGDDLYYDKLIVELNKTTYALSKVEGDISPEQALVLNLQIAELKGASNVYLMKGKTEDKAVPNLLAVIEQNAKEELLFYTTVGKYRKALGLGGDDAYFAKINQLSKQLDANGLSYDDIRNVSAELHLSTIDYLRRAAAGQISWKMSEAEKEKFIKDTEKEILTKNYNDIAGKYDLRDSDSALIKEAQLSLEELESLPCLQGIEKIEDRNEALHKYLDEVGKYNHSNLPEEYAEALDESGLSITDVRVLAVRQGISFDTYMNRMMGKEEAELDYGEGGIAPDKGRDSIDKQIDENIIKMNETLRNTAKNPLEALMAEKMIEMKEASFARGKRNEMEICLANFVALKTIQKYLNVKDGEDFTNNPEKMEKFDTLTRSLDRYKEDVLKNDTFRYFVKKMKTDELTDLSRGESLNPLNSCYDKFFKMMANRKLDDTFENAADKMMVYTQWAIGRETFLGEKINSAGNFISDPKNPYNLSVTRSSLVTLSIGTMVKRGFEFEDALDPYALMSAKRDVGSEVFDLIQTDTPETRRTIAGAYLTALEQSIALANKQLINMNSLAPQEVFRNNDKSFLAVTTLLKDANQELGTLKKNGFLNEEELKKFDKLSKEADAINKCYGITADMINGVIDIKKMGNPENSILKVVQGAVMNQAFKATRAAAIKNGKTISEQMLDEFNANPAAQNSMVNSYATGALAAGEFMLPRGMAAKIMGSKTLSNSLAKDVFTGEIMKLVSKVGENGGVEFNMKYLDKFEKNAPEAEINAPGF